MKLEEGQRVVLLEETMWMAAMTKRNTVGRVPAGEKGTVIMSDVGLAVDFDQIPAKKGYVFLIGQSPNRFRLEES